MDDTNSVAGARQRIQIKVPEQYRNINEEVWKDLEEYIFTGFLSSSAVFLGHSFVFKTLNHHEIRNIWHLRQGSKDQDGSFRSAFIAHSMFVALGRNVLHQRPEHINKLMDLVTNIPVAYQEKIVQNLNSLNKRASRLYPLVEVYVHESRSRFRWLYSKKLPVHSTDVTGIPGTIELGMNYCQQTWVAMNEVMDKKEDVEVSWSHAKFIGSCSAGKGMIAIDEQDKARRNREQQELEELKAKVLREYVAQTDGKEISTDEGTVPLPDGRRAVVDGRFKAETVEELADQLSSALSGEKDWHDKVVEDNFRRVRAEQEALARQSRQLAAMPRQLAEAAGRPATAGARVLSRENADEYVKRMQALMINPPAAPVSPPDLPDDVDRSKLRGNRDV